MATLACITTCLRGEVGHLGRDVDVHQRRAGGVDVLDRGREVGADEVEPRHLGTHVGAVGVQALDRLVQGRAGIDRVGRRIDRGAAQAKGSAADVGDGDADHVGGGSTDLEAHGARAGDVEADAQGAVGDVEVAEADRDASVLELDLAVEHHLAAAQVTWTVSTVLSGLVRVKVSVPS